MYLQLGHKVVDAVAKQVHRSEAAGQEGTPPPVVVLSNATKRNIGLTLKSYKGEANHFHPLIKKFFGH